MTPYPSYLKPLFMGPDFTLDGVTIVLSTRAHAPLGPLSNVDNSSITLKTTLTEGNSLSFTVYKTMNGIDEPLWDQLIDHKLIFVPELDDYLEITVTETDSVAEKKAVSAVSAGIAELSQTNLYEFEANTEDDIARDDYVITKFYDPNNKKGSLLHRILEKTPQYSLGYVSDSLKNLQRTISVSGKDVWSALTDDVAKAFDCLFLVDNKAKKLYVYDLEISCDDCGERFEWASEDEIGTCPKCKGKNLSYFGEDSTFYVDKENLTDEITVTVDADSIKNTMRLKAGDDLMTSTVQALNPNGTDYLTDFNEAALSDMPDDLVEKLKDYQALYDEKLPEYQKIMEDLFKAYDWELWYDSAMMPGAEDPDGKKQGESSYRGTVSAETEANKLSPTAFPAVGMLNLTEKTPRSTVDAAVLNYARTIVRAGFVKLEIQPGSTFTYTGGGSGTWNGSFKVINYSTINEKEEDQDIATTPALSVHISSDYKAYLDQFLYKSIKRQATNEDDLIYDVLKIKDDETYRKAIELYSRARLQSFKDAYENCLAILSGEVDNLYAKAYEKNYGEKAFQEKIYDPYVKRLSITTEALNERTAEVEKYSSQIEALNQQKAEIQKALNFKDFLGEDLFKTYCAYRREDIYENDNFSSEGLNNADLFKEAKEFLDDAKKELHKASTPQYTVSLDLYTLLHKKEYQPLAPYFLLGNWIHVRAGEKLYRLRLTEQELSFSDPAKISTTFSNVTRTSSLVSDVKSILDAAKSMATSYDAVAKQASLGEDALYTQKNFFTSGLLSASTRVKTNTDESITWGKFGILARQYDDITQSYNDEQLQITHNVIAFTSDGWKHARAAIGKQTFTTYDEDQEKYVDKEGYGVNAQFMQSGQLNGTQIIGGKIFSSAFKTDTDGHETPVSSIDLDTGEFSLGDGALTFTKGTDGSGTLKIHGSGEFSGDITGATGTFAGSLSGADITGANGLFSGSIQATKGTIGGIDINETGLSANSDRLYIYNESYTNSCASMSRQDYSSLNKTSTRNIGRPIAKIGNAIFCEYGVIFPQVGLADRANCAINAQSADNATHANRATWADTATTANSVLASNISGSISASKISGTVSSASYATSAGSASNATYATSAGSASSASRISGYTITRLYRLYNPNSNDGAHMFTTKSSDRDRLVRLGWVDESATNPMYVLT